MGFKKGFKPKLISDLIAELETIKESEGDIPVCTHNDPYMSNQWGFPIEDVSVKENPSYIVNVSSYRNRSRVYKGKVVFID